MGAQHVSASQPLGRIPYVDGLRGYLIYSMTLSHLGFLGPNLFTHLSHKTFSIFFTGEGFMALSGLMVGYILYRPYIRHGLGKTLGNSLRRSWKIVKYYVAVYVLCALPLLFVDLQSHALLGDYFRLRDPIEITSFGLFLGSVYRPLMFDILYLYIILIGLTPLLIWVALRFGIATLASISFGLWVTVQYQLPQKVTVKIGEMFQVDPAHLFGNFSIFAWQFPFVVGVILGMATASNPDRWPAIFDWLRTHVFGLAAGLCVVFAVFNLLALVGPLNIGYLFFSNYLTLSPLTLLNFICFCLVLVMLLHPPTPQAHRLTVTLHQGLAWLLNSRLLTVVGSNSLLTFSASVVLTYWVVAAKPYLETLGYSLAINTLVFSVVIALIYGTVLVFNALKRGTGRPLPEKSNPS